MCVCVCVCVRKSERVRAGGGGGEESKTYRLKETYVMYELYLYFNVVKQTVKNLYDTIGKIITPTGY